MDSDLVIQIDPVVMSRQGKAEGGEVRFLCPAHDDHHPSARWNRTKAVWHCDACGKGGGALDLARRLGIPLPDRGPAGLSMSELAEAKGLSVEFLRSLGVAEGISGSGRIKCVDVPYLDASGEILSLRKRLNLTTEPRFAWRRGDKAVPYGLWRLNEARAGGRLILVEGESDCWTLWNAGLAALGIPGGSTWKEAWRAYLTGVAAVYLWHEPDPGGDSLISRVAADLPDVRVIEARPEAKDPNAIWLTLEQDPERLRGHLDHLMAEAKPASEIRAEALSDEARKLYSHVRELLQAPDLLDKIGEAISSSGYAGNLTPPLLAYISLTSRLLERPLNLAFIAPSSAGKNRAVDAALELMPDEAYHLEKAGSARALVYSDADFAHRIVVVCEADSIPDDGPAASAVRSIASDFVMCYDVVEKDPSTGQFKTRRIEKPGPTGLITTSTRRLGEQMGTRLLSVSVDDTPGQTRAVLLSHAASVNGAKPACDLSSLIDLQRWLQISGDHTVTIPFARALATAVPDRIVRMRRDFRQLLTVIQTVALLYQIQRQRDSDRRIIAEIDDYRVARQVLLDTFSASASGGLSRQVRETIAAVHELYDGQHPLTIKTVGDKLGLAKDTAWYRVRRAISLGHIVNLETKKGQPARLIPGESLPDDHPALPSPAELEALVYSEEPNSRSTVQPDGDQQIHPVSEDPVESAVETPVQPDIQPPLTLDIDIETGAEEDAVERLNAITGHVPTETVPERHYAFALAEELEFPALRLRPGESVAAGRAAWQTFIDRADRDRLNEATHKLEEKSRSPVQPEDRI